MTFMGLLVPILALTLVLSPIDTIRKDVLLAAGAIIMGIVMVLIVRRTMSIPCPACKADLAEAIGAAMRRGASLQTCPRCGSNVRHA